MSRIIVIGSAHHNTLGMLRSLGFAGFKVDLILIGHRKKFVSKSRYVNRLFVFSDFNELRQHLDANYRNETQKTIIISCTDAVASFLDQRYEELKHRFDFFNSGDTGRITAYMNKEYQVRLAKEVGLQIPQSYVYNGEINSSIFPCLLKPLCSSKGGKQVVICQNEVELLEGISSFKKNIEVLVQKFIKREHEIVVLGLSVNGRIIIPGYILKHRDFDGGTLYSSVKSICSLSRGLIKRCEDMINKLNYEGLFGIELIFCKGTYYFIEVNLRNDATTYALTKAGVNLPELYIKAKSEKIHISENFAISEIKSIVEFNDFKHRKDFGISIFQWLREYFGASCKYYFNWRDPMPFFYAPFK